MKPYTISEWAATGAAVNAAAFLACAAMVLGEGAPLHAALILGGALWAAVAACLLAVMAHLQRRAQDLGGDRGEA